MRDCHYKFNVYILYSARSKNFSRRYSIHIDIYEKFLLKFRGRLLFPINFQFLPVHHLSFIADILQGNSHDENVQLISVLMENV